MENQKQPQNPKSQYPSSKLTESLPEDRGTVLEVRGNYSANEVMLDRGTALKASSSFLSSVVEEGHGALPQKPKFSRSQRSKFQPSYRVTDRDVEILKFINDFGFVEMPHLDRRFGLKKPRNYQLMNKLVEAGLVHHERVFFGRHGVYRLTAKGAAMTELPHLARINLGTYKHDIVLIETYLNLRMQHPDASWVSERQLMKDKHAAGVGQRGHLPDGVLIFSDEKQVAIEVELSLKGKHRLERILKGYGGAFSYKEVWYYCSANIISPMRSMAAKMPFIKIHGLVDGGVL